MARVRWIAAAGVPPRVMGIGPPTGLHEWEMDFEDPRLNPNGGLYGRFGGGGLPIRPSTALARAGPDSALDNGWVPMQASRAPA